MLCRVTALGRGQESVHVTVGMKETCVMSAPTFTLKSKMKILKPNVQVSLEQYSRSFKSLVSSHLFQVTCFKSLVKSSQA